MIDAWLAALERRHLANLTSAELTRALRALSSCYVERRAKLAQGAALEGAGKRAAFALFYGPLHAFTVTEIVRALDAGVRSPATIVDFGCGTGVAGAAWALACDSRPHVIGIDRSAWAVAEANWTYGALSIRGRARRGDIEAAAPGGTDSALIMAYALNELAEDARERVLDTLLSGPPRPLLIVEAIAKRDKPWWPRWVDRLAAAGARADEWRFPARLPPTQHRIAVAAGLTSDTLTARTIYRR